MCVERERKIERERVPFIIPVFNAVEIPSRISNISVLNEDLRDYSSVAGDVK